MWPCLKCSATGEKISRTYTNSKTLKSLDSRKKKYLTSSR